MDAYLAGYGSTDSETDDDSATNKNLAFVGPAARTAPAAAQLMKSYPLFSPMNHPGKRASGSFAQRAASPRAPLPSLADAAAAVERRLSLELPAKQKLASRPPPTMTTTTTTTVCPRWLASSALALRR